MSIVLTSFFISLLAGLGTGLGGLIGVIRKPGRHSFGFLMGRTTDELILKAREHGHQHTTAVGIIPGAIFVFLLSGWFGV